jgi:signal transduction histidine kinase
VQAAGRGVRGAILFELFTRPAEDADGANQGLGLGLYIASEIVHAHGATISVSSQEGEGTTFTIRWPRRVPSRPRTTT